MKFEGIKSLYNLKEIFSLVRTNRKMNIIIYNKELQKKIGIDIEDYKKKSGKYKIGKRVGKRIGKGAEYTRGKNKLIFEGEYLNGKRNGKGKESYENGKLKFEGKYLNGLRNGKGKEYKIYKFVDYDYNWCNDYYEYDVYLSELAFKGKYLNGKRNGKGKEYYKNRTLKFQGEYLNGLKNGKGIEYYFPKYFLLEKKIKFEGQYLNGLKNGNGKEYFENGEIKFEGEYLNGKRWNGKIYKYNYKIKECTPLLGFNYFEIKNGKGKIKDYYDNGEIKFEGEYLNGLKNGNGKEYYKPKDCKTNRCDYANNNNKGKLENEGKDLNDDYDDDYNNRNIKYKGEYLNGLRNGKGKVYDRNGKLIFEGEYFKGKRKK